MCVWICRGGEPDSRQEPGRKLHICPGELNQTVLAARPPLACELEAKPGGGQ